jgi:hypothetical protein
MRKENRCTTSELAGFHPIIYFLLQCWAKVPTDRPTFQALRDFFSETLPPVMKATQKYDEADKLHIEAGDAIVVIDGRYLTC